MSWRGGHMVMGSGTLDRGAAKLILFLLFGAPVMLLLHDCYRRLK